MVRLQAEAIDYAALVDAVCAPECGGVVLFLGTVREQSGGRAVASLDYQAYPSMAEKQLARIVEEARQQWPIARLAVVHRTGHLEIGEVSVAVAVSCPHRAQAFDACRFLIDRLKEVVPIWKRENWADGGSIWVHPSDSTHEPAPED